MRAEQGSRARKNRSFSDRAFRKPDAKGTEQGEKRSVQTKARRDDAFQEKGRGSRKAPETAKKTSAVKAGPRAVSAEGADNFCWGRNPVLTLLRCRPDLCKRVLVMAGCGDFGESVIRLCAECDIHVDVTDKAELDRLTGGAVHQGVAARMLPLPPADLDDLVKELDPEKPALIVLLDHCQDPHNLGAVIRTAEIAGASCVICQNDRSATVNGTVVKTSAGAAFRLPVAQVVNVKRTLDFLKERGFWVVGLDHHTEETIWSNPLPERLVLVVGSEGDGISALTLKNCDKLVKFPMAGKTGNLNASVAGALGMFEWVRLYGCRE